MICETCSSEFSARIGQRFCSRRCAGMRSVSARLIAKRVVDLETGCWIWTGSRNKAGYGSISWEGRRESVHRVAYIVFVGPIPDGLHIDHVYEAGCRNNACFNPNHLEPVTVAENNRRSLARRGRDTHCAAGHEYTVANTRVVGGHRWCRRCDAQRKRRYALLSGRTEALVEVPSAASV